jgi:hypothetical protein
MAYVCLNPSIRRIHQAIGFGYEDRRVISVKYRVRTFCGRGVGRTAAWNTSVVRSLLLMEGLCLLGLRCLGSNWNLRKCKNGK